MVVRNGSEKDKQDLLNKYPDLQNFFVMCDTGYLIVAEKENDIIGFLWAYKRDIPAPIEAQKYSLMQLKYLMMICGVKGSAQKWFKS